jgi:hypothetical protein
MREQAHHLQVVRPVHDLPATALVFEPRSHRRHWETLHPCLFCRHTHNGNAVVCGDRQGKRSPSRRWLAYGPMRENRRRFEQNRNRER